MIEGLKGWLVWKLGGYPKWAHDNCMDIEVKLGRALREIKGLKASLEEARLQRDKAALDLENLRWTVKHDNEIHKKRDAKVAELQRENRRLGGEIVMLKNGEI